MFNGPVFVPVGNNSFGVLPDPSVCDAGPPSATLDVPPVPGSAFGPSTVAVSVDDGAGSRRIQRLMCQLRHRPSLTVAAFCRLCRV